MNIVVEKQPKCVATLSVEIPAEKAQAKREQILSGYVTKAKIPGFRPGKAPRTIVEKRYAREIEEIFADELMQEALKETVKQEQDLAIMYLGQQKDFTVHADGRVTFVSELMLKPKFDLPTYQGTKVAVPAIELPEARVAMQFAEMQQRMADFNDVKGRAAQEGDLVVINYTTSVAGQPTEEFLGRKAGYLGGRDAHWMKLTDESFLPGAAAQMVGMNTGESRDVTLTLAEDFISPELRNQEMVLHVTLTDIKETVLPEINDEFAARLLPGKTLEDLRELVLTEIQGQYDRELSDIKVNKIMEALLAQVDFELPEPMLNDEIQNQVDRMVERASKNGMTDAQINEQKEEIFQAATANASASLRTNFILNAIADAENIQVSDVETVNHLVSIANDRKIAPKKFLRDVQRQGRIPAIRQSMVIGKTIDFLLERVDFEQVELDTPGT